MDNKRVYASILSGLTEVSLTHPIDYMKTIKQSNRGVKDFWRNPYKGVGSRLTGVIPIRMVFWNVLGECRARKYSSFKTGVIVASFQTLLDYPFEQIKIQKMINNSSWRNAFYGPTIIPGFMANLGRNIGFAVVLNYAISQNDVSPIMSGMGGFAGALLTHPLDTLKTHYQHSKTFSLPNIRPIEYFNGCTYRCSISLISMGVGWTVFSYLGLKN